MVDVAAEDCGRDGSDEHASMAWELNDANMVFALLARNTEAEGLEPMTVDEVKM